MLKIGDILKFIVCYIIIVPFIGYILCSFSVTTREIDYYFVRESNFEKRFILQTYKWGKGNYFISKGDNPNIDESLFCNNEYIYIKNISGNSPEKVFSKYISSMIQTKLFFNTETINTYGVEGELIPTNEIYNGIKVFDLNVSRISMVSQINRSNIGDALLPEYDLTILDYKIFSNIYLDFLFVLICSGVIYVSIYKMLNHIYSFNCIFINRLILTYFSILIATVLFLAFAYLIIRVLYLAI